MTRSSTAYRNQLNWIVLLYLQMFCPPLWRAFSRSFPRKLFSFLKAQLLQFNNNLIFPWPFTRTQELRTLVCGSYLIVQVIQTSLSVKTWLMHHSRGNIISYIFSPPQFSICTNSVHIHTASNGDFKYYYFYWLSMFYLINHNIDSTIFVITFARFLNKCISLLLEVLCTCKTSLIFHFTFLVSK